MLSLNAVVAVVELYLMCFHILEGCHASRTFGCKSLMSVSSIMICVTHDVKMLMCDVRPSILLAAQSFVGGFCVLQRALVFNGKLSSAGATAGADNEKFPIVISMFMC